jgi:peptide/nickel transport system substrate-binding protein
MSKTALNVSLTCLAGILLVSACSSGGSPTGTSSLTAGRPQQGGAITVGIAGPPGSLDPAVTALDEAGEIDRQIFDSLVYETPSHQYSPWLATSWKISPNGKSYTFTLRKGVTFQDGTPFNAAAVKFNLDRIVNPKTGSELANQLIAPYSSSQVINNYAIKVNLKTPYAPLLSGLSEPFLGMVSPTAVGKEGVQGFAAHPVGTGPFKFDHESGQNEVVLTRNAHYAWPPQGATHSGSAYLTTITFRAITEDSSRVAALQSGQLDIAEQIPPVNASSLTGGGFDVLTSVAPGVPYWLALNEQHPPWNQEAARQAVRDGLDISSITKILFFGLYQRAWGPLTSATPSYDPSLVNSFSYNPTEAGNLLNSLGWKLNHSTGYREKGGKTLSMLYLGQSGNPEGRLDVAHLMAMQLKKIGINVTVQVLTFPGILAAVQKGDYDIAGVDDVNADPSVLAQYFQSTNQPTPKVFGVNWAHLDIPQVDSWLQQGATSTSQSVRNSAYDQVQQYVTQHVIGIPVDVPTSIIGTSTRAHGVEHDPSTNFLDFYSTWVGSAG